MTNEPPARSAMGSPTLLVFLGYEGTLDECAQTSPVCAVNTEVAALLSRLRDEPRTRVAILSGLPLDHLRRLVGIAGIFLAASYGLEIQTPHGDILERPVASHVDDLSLRAAFTRDEEAFSVVRKHGGMCVRVGRHQTRTGAQYCLETPAHVRCWLASLCAQ